jgi:hypothetical protein
MTTSFCPRRLTALLGPAAAFAVATLVVALVLPAGALARAPKPSSAAHKASCVSGSARAKRRARACAGSKHKGKSHHASKRHHAKRSVKQTGSTAPAGASQVPARCEDGSPPLRVKDGSFSCFDGSEPGCEGNSIPKRSSSGAALLCPAPSKESPESGCEDVSNPECSFGGSSTEALCEDSSSPVSASDGSISCDDKSEPACENGSTPTLSASSTLLCEAPPTSDSRS